MTFNGLRMLASAVSASAAEAALLDLAVLASAVLAGAVAAYAAVAGTMAPAVNASRRHATWRAHAVLLVAC